MAGGGGVGGGGGGGCGRIRNVQIRKQIHSFSAATGVVLVDEIWVGFSASHSSLRQELVAMKLEQDSKALTPKCRKALTLKPTDLRKC